MSKKKKYTNVAEAQFGINRIEARSQGQRDQMSAMIADDMIIATGPAGTGKTFLAACKAAQMLHEEKRYDKILLTRPNVEVGKPMGFLPGEMEDKYAPYLAPFLDGLTYTLGKGRVDNYKRNGKIEACPIGFMRGRTYDNCIMLLDEAQNTTITEMKMIITRMGVSCKLFITGDIDQKDIRDRHSGLDWLVQQIEKQQLPFEVIRYQRDECVRSEPCKENLKMIANEVALT